MSTRPEKVAFVGFGEAAAAFVEGWAGARPRVLAAYDIKTDSTDAAVREAKRADYLRSRVDGAATLAEALTGAGVVFSVVTADQALIAARGATACIVPGAVYFDCNSCAPGTKRQAAELIEAAGGRYVDAAVMAPVRPALHHVPMLISGPHVGAVLGVLAALDMRAKPAAGPVGQASSIKMIRSVMVKGLEALVAECVLAGRKAGVDAAVLDSLEVSFPGFNWEARAAYMLERMMVYGIRRAAEMREVALTVEELGLGGTMARATVDWEQRIGDLHLEAPPADYRARADAVLDAISAPGETASADSRGDYHDIPGTYVFDAQHSRLGYHLNMFCMSLNLDANRAAFRAGEAAYLDRYPMAPAQKAAILKRDWNEMLRLGGNIYYTAKLAATDGITFQDLAAAMTGVSRDEYRKMMVDGGRPIEGNRSKSEWNRG
jgi:protocatechuate 4,5-dioxygenase alpha subunit